MRAGITFRSELAAWLATRPGEVRCLEMSVDGALSASHSFRARRIRRWPTALHASQLAVGTPRTISCAEVERAIDAIRAVNPMWICAYLGSRYRPETEPSYPHPVPLTGESLGRAVANCRRLVDAGVRPLLVENVAAFGVPAERISPADFINKLCEESGCGLLLDVTTLILDAQLGFDPRRWLWNVDPAHVAAMRVRTRPARARSVGADSVDSCVPDDAWMLAREIAARTSAETAILQCRGECPTIDEVRADLCLAAAVDRFAVPTEALPTAAHALV